MALAGLFGFALNAAGIITPVAYSIADAIPQNHETTVVSIVTGDDPGNLKEAGGTVPHVAIWDNAGKRIGQWHSADWDKMDQGGDPRNIVVQHSQNGNKYADPYYVMLSQMNVDAICIASIQVSNGVISGTFYGDTGYTCGQSWYYSKRKIGNTFAQPKCVWLDGDHTNGINARALSFHLNDMIPSADKIDEYSRNLDTLCKSTPRYSFWGNLLPDGIIPFFDPPLEYGEDSVSGGEGADKDPSKAIDSVEFDKGVYLHQGETSHKRSNNRPGPAGSQPVSRRDGNNHNPSHLVTTEMDGHSAKELCEHPNSYGWDLVSIQDGMYCDMVHKKLYKLCDETVKSNCFDFSTKSLVGGITARGEPIAVPEKKYETHAHWKN